MESNYRSFRKSRKKYGAQYPLEQSNELRNNRTNFRRVFPSLNFAILVWKKMKNHKDPGIELSIIP